jgi:hypothetical protein
MGNDILRIGTIIFSLLSLPILALVFFQVYKDGRRFTGIDKKVELLLLALFLVLFITAVMSVFIAGTSHMQDHYDGALTFDLTTISRARSCFLINITCILQNPKDWGS